MEREYPFPGVTISTRGPVVLSLHVESFLAHLGLNTCAAHQHEVIGRILETLGELAGDVTVGLAPIPEEWEGGPVCREG